MLIHITVIPSSSSHSPTCNLSFPSHSLQPCSPRRFTLILIPEHWRLVGIPAGAKAASIIDPGSRLRDLACADRESNRTSGS